MGFSAKQVRALQRSVPSDKVRVRRLNGRELAYIEGWQAISEANRIFGFAGWDRETLEARCIVGRDVRGTLHAIYAAKVRVTVRAEGTSVVREGSGTGEARSASPGEAHETALKAAETDATKRALATFGKPFGLALYLTGRPVEQQRDPAGRQATPMPASLNVVAHVPRGLGQVETVGRAPVEAHLDNLPKTIGSDVSSIRSGVQYQSNDHHGAPAGSVAITNGSQSGPEMASTGSHSVFPESGLLASAIEQSVPDRNTATFRQDATAPPGSPAGAPQADASASTNASRPSPIPSSREFLVPTPSPMAVAARVDKSVLPFGAPRRERDKHHLQFVARQPCLICSRVPSDAHHLRFAQTRAMGRKVGDQFTVPLCRMHHRQVHDAPNEADWWSDLEIDALGIASGLWEESRAKRAALVRSLPGSIDPLRG